LKANIASPTFTGTVTGNEIIYKTQTLDDRFTNKGQNDTVLDNIGIELDTKLDKSGGTLTGALIGTTATLSGALFAGSANISGDLNVVEVELLDWLQLGGDIDGEALDDEFGWSVSLSSDGRTVAIGAPRNDVNGSNSGHVRVFSILGSSILSAVSANITGALTTQQLIVNSNASISGALSAGSANITGSLQARYIRFQRETNDTFTNLSEIEVYGLDGIQLDNSTWVVAMSSQNGNNVGANLIDEDFVNFAHTNSGIGQWIEVDMGELKIFSHLKLFNRPSSFGRAIGLTVILKDNNGDEINTPLIDDNGAYGIVSGSTRRVITSGNATYTFRNTALNVYGPVIFIRCFIRWFGDFIG